MLPSAQLPRQGVGTRRKSVRNLYVRGILSLCIPKPSLQLEERERERAAFATMQRPDFDGSGGAKIQGDMHETWIDKLKKGWAQEPLLPLVPVGMKSLVSVHLFHIGCVNGTKYKCVTGPGSSDNRTKI